MVNLSICEIYAKLVLLNVLQEGYGLTPKSFWPWHAPSPLSGQAASCIGSVMDVMMRILNERAMFQCMLGLPTSIKALTR